MSWQVFIEGDDHRAYAWDSLLVVVFDGPTSVAGARAVQQIHRDRVLEVRSLSSITILVGDLQFQVDPEVRRIASEIAKESSSIAVAGAVVVPSDGWVATVFRSIITGVHLMARVKTPHKVFSQVEEAVRWICSRPEQAPAVAEHADSILAACDRSGVTRSRTAAADR